MSCNNIEAQIQNHTAFSGDPAPKPQLAPREGTTPNEQKCIDLAYILYLLEYYNPEISQQDAYDNYLANFDSCYGE